MLTPKQLRDCLCGVIGDDLGQYARPGLTAIPSIWVKDRPLPADYTVIKAHSYEQALVNCFEVVIDPNPMPRDRTRNTRKKAIDWVWRVDIIQHDKRQFFTNLITNFYAHFSQLDQPLPLEGTDLYPAQLQWRIPFLDSLEVE